VKTFFAALALAFTFAAITPSASACIPKIGPSCDCDMPGVAGTVACDPRTNLGCN